MKHKDKRQLKRTFHSEIRGKILPDFAHHSPLILMEGCLYGICSGSLIGAISFWFNHSVLSDPVSTSNVTTSILGLCMGGLSGAFIGSLLGTSLAYFVSGKKVQDFEESLQISADKTVNPSDMHDNSLYIQEWKVPRGEYSTI